MLFVRGLSPEEVEQLRVFMRTTRDARLLKRAIMVWLSHQGKTTTEIATELDVDEQTVRGWIRAYEERGLDGLRDDPRPGRTPTVTPLYVETLLDWVPKSPRLANLPAQRWTLELLRDFLENQTGIRISIEWVRRLLVEHEIKRLRPKSTLYSPDPLYDQKVEAIRAAIADAPPGTPICFQDETDLHLNPRIEASYQPGGGQVKVRSPGKNQKRHAFGIVDVTTGRVVLRFTRRKRSREFIAFVRQLLAAYPGTRILLVIDNYGIHSSKASQAFLHEHADRIRILPLPTYSPHLNPIEPYWKYLKRHVNTNVLHESGDALVKWAKAWLRRYVRGTVDAFRFALPRKFGELC